MVLLGDFPTQGAWITIVSVRPRSMRTGSLGAWQRWMPRGTALTPESWRSRHHIVIAITAAHIPLAFLIARLSNLDPALPLAGSLVVVVALAVALRAPTRLVGMSASAIALLSCSAGLIAMSGGLPATHFHIFLAIGVISLYQSWQVLLLGLAFVFTELGVIGLVEADAIYENANVALSGWAGLMIDALLVVGAAAINLTFWSLQERAHARAEEYYRQLYEGEQAVSEYLRTTQLMKDQLVSMVSHEFRTPLTCILGFTRTLAEHGSDVSEELRMDFLTRIVGHGERLHRLIENLLVASRVVEPDRNAVGDVRAQLMAVTSEMAKGGASVHTTVDRGELRVRMGRDSLYHVFYNLIENGVKFARPGTSPRVGVWREGDALVVEVANQGKPIALGDQIRIFDPFIQVDGSSTRVVDGLGMGLAVVRALTEAHGGAVGVRSDSQETVFWLRLPRAERQERRYDPGSCTRPPSASRLSKTSTAT